MNGATRQCFFNNASNQVIISLDGVSPANYNFIVAARISKATPAITWSNPSAITYGAALSNTQLCAYSLTPGTFSYSQAVGTVIGAGTQTLSTTFTPTDALNYITVSKSVTISVQKATPVITWSPSSAVLLTPLNSTQLNAVSSVPGAFVYYPVAGTVFQNYNTRTLSTTFTPTDTADYNAVSKSVTVAVIAKDLTQHQTEQAAKVAAISSSSTKRTTYMLDPHPVDIENKHPIHL